MKWIARIVLLILFLLFLWILFKKKNGLTSRKKIKAPFNFNIHDETIKLLENISLYYNNPFERSQQLLSTSTQKQPQKRWKMEEECRRILEGLFDKTFVSIRPEFLKSPMTKKNLELDCYNEELKLALEYNGKQHYSYCPYFHKNKKAFYAQVHRDNWKRQRCMEYGITLIEVPYYIPKEELPQFIIKQLQLRGYTTL